MAHVSGGDVYLDHSAQEVDDNIEEVVEARRGHTSLAQAIAEAAQPYVLPKASASELGGVKVGEGLSIEDDGTLKVVGGGSYSETELLAAPLSGTISSISLTDSIENYDQLIFRYGIVAENQNQAFTFTILTSDLSDTSNAFIVGATAYGSGTYYSIHYRITKATNTSLTVHGQGISGWSPPSVIFSIKGIKYTSDAS
jgi:hypothetical protein